MDNFVNITKRKLNLNDERGKNIKLFYNTVSYYKMRPYIDFIQNNPEIETKLKEKIGLKDSWDSVTFLYRYNIKLSTAIYAYIYILEIAIKTKINNLLINSCSKNWYADFAFINRANKKTIPFLQ